MCGVSKVPDLRLRRDAGTFCERYHNLLVRELMTRRVQCGELWSFVGCKAKTKAAGGEGHGDAWVWVAIDAESKLVISYRVGNRDVADAYAFASDLANRVARRIQITSDGLAAYTLAIPFAFPRGVDFAQLIKTFAADRRAEARYSPPVVTSVTERVVCGQPNSDEISTSYVERQNLTVRMGSRRFTRLTNAFSKALANHVAAVHLHYFHYNFVRKHLTLKTTPAVAAEVADRPFTMLDLATMIAREENIVGGRITNYLPAVAS